MAQALKSISISLFALLILAVSSGFYINKHYCGQELKRVSFNQEAPSCHELQDMEIQAPGCHKPTARSCHSEPVEDCCQSEYQNIKTDQYTFQNQNLTFEVQCFTVVIPVVDLIFDLNTSNQINPINLAEAPPPNTPDKQVLFQSFLL